MRNGRGSYLVEMLVVTALTSIFVLLLGSMLSQVLRISTQAQNEFIAANVAEILIENAKCTPYSTISNSANQNIEFDVVINTTGTSPLSFPYRSLPVQLDLSDGRTLFGAVDGSNGNLQELDKWTPTSGNFFRGKVTEKIEDASGQMSGLNSLKVSITVSYYNESGKLKNKQVRSAYIFERGSNFR